MSRALSMAFRIHENVVRGEIDNRQRGTVLGQIWLLGSAEPIALALSGNCGRDLAGCLLRFENTRPSISNVAISGRLFSEFG